MVTSPVWAVLNKIDLDAANKAEFLFCYVLRSFLRKEERKQGRKEARKEEGGRKSKCN